MRVILSTRNASKVEQIKAFFSNTLISILTLDDVGIEGQAIENGTTLEGNAFKKALFGHRPTMWSMADDTGLFIDALDGRPGVFAARWAGETATTHEVMEYTLAQLKGVSSRSATFKTCVALISPDGEVNFFEGSVRGKLLDAPRAKPQPHMPYSALFVPDGQEKVWAEMTIREENEISHRGVAFRLAREYLSAL